MSIDDDALGELLDELEIGLELNSAGPAIEPLLNALIGEAPQAALRQAAVEAVEALWDADLEQEVRTELEDFRGRAVEENARLVPTIDTALAQLGAPARQNRVAHALVWRAATKLVRRASRNHERVAELERALERAPQARRRRLTLPIAAAASLAADVGDQEAATAVAAYAFSASASRRPSRKQHDRATARLARTLATDERRRATRLARRAGGAICRRVPTRVAGAARAARRTLPRRPGQRRALGQSRRRPGPRAARGRPRRRGRALSPTPESS